MIARPNRPRRLLLAFAPRTLPRRGVAVGTANGIHDEPRNLFLSSKRNISLSAKDLVPCVSFFSMGSAWAYYFVLGEGLRPHQCPLVANFPKGSLDLASLGFRSWVLRTFGLFLGCTLLGHVGFLGRPVLDTSFLLFAPCAPGVQPHISLGRPFLHIFAHGGGEKGGNGNGNPEKGEPSRKY